MSSGLLEALLTKTSMLSCMSCPMLKNIFNWEKLIYLIPLHGTKHSKVLIMSSMLPPQSHQEFQKTKMNLSNLLFKELKMSLMLLLNTKLRDLFSHQVVWLSWSELMEKSLTKMTGHKKIYFIITQKVNISLKNYSGKKLKNIKMNSNLSVFYQV